MFRPLYRYRWLLYELVMRDVFIRYRGSVLGILWTLITPLLFALIYIVVFSLFLRINMPNYAVFLIAGLLPWQWFATSLQAGTNAIVDGRTYITNSVLPPILLAVVPVLSNFVHFLLSYAIMLVIALFLHVHFGWAMLVLPFLFAIQLIFTLGLTLLAATLHVFYRDALQLVAILLALVFYLIPIVYPLSLVPERFRLLLMANPLTALILSYQDVFAHNAVPHWPSLLYSLGASLALLYAGRVTFNRYRELFAEYV